MANDEIRIVYPLMEEMRSALKDALQQLNATKQEMMSIASTMEGGALLGKTGSAFVEALRDKLCSAIARLSDQITEMDKGVHNAMKVFEGEVDPDAAQKIRDS